MAAKRVLRSAAVERNGVAGLLPPDASPKGRGKAAAAVPVQRSERARRWLTVGMGCGIPAMSLALSSIGGQLYQDGEELLGVVVLGLCSSVLAVSLSHLAWAVRDITRSERWQSWCLALGIDVTLVVGEVACVVGSGWWLVYCVMGLVTVASAVLNCWAFLRPAV